ncbi:MAG TPA: hypothetical protein VFF07_16695 [Actinomycetota bacterium]|nr:hypothetical protein [Actinomycetota bacterium]
MHIAEHAAHRLGKAMAGLTAVLLAVAGMALLGNSSLLMPARSLGASPGCS